MNEIIYPIDNRFHKCHNFAMISNVVKTKLKELLKARDKTLLSLAKETGVSYNTLHKIKKNDVKSISFDVLEKICRNLDCTASDLLSIENSVGH